MLVNRYIDLKYNSEINEHYKGYCSCDLKEGGKGLCTCGRYIEGLISPQDFLEENNDKFYDIRYGTFVRTDLDDIARIIGVEVMLEKTYFILDREVEKIVNKEIIKTNKIREYNVDKHSNDLKDLVQVGDIVNGYRIIRIDKDKLWYGYWRNEYINGEVKEVLVEKNYSKYSIVS